ncbi:hypothetical protein [Bosea sp. AAP35]|uniref:hypothetical protein n=1 Tax=Bosea sp. AAP35 TaxID=1523417 RepID=UPI0006B967D4|nr:hypothetical protein [Bosea sp. AAP35]
MFKKLAWVAVAGAALLWGAAANSQIVGNEDPFATIRPGPGRQAPPPAAQPRQRPQQPPAQAQPYGRGDQRGYDRGSRYDDRGPRYDDRGPRYDRGPRFDDDGPRYRRGGGGGFGDFCATSRGACRTRPQPVGTSCRCDIDGLPKRGIIR